MDSIHFFQEDIEFEIPNPNAVRKFLKDLIANENYKLQSLNYIFCSDEYLREVNVQYLDHDYHTDVITFDNSESPQAIDGDIFISIDRIRDHAQDYKVPFMHELIRVMAHGLLHLVGYDDKTDELQQIMRQKENSYLAKFVF